METLLSNCKDLSDNDEATFIARLREITLKQQKLLAKKLSLKFTGSITKAEVINRMLTMDWIGAIRGDSILDNDCTTNIYA